MQRRHADRYLPIVGMSRSVSQPWLARFVAVQPQPPENAEPYLPPSPLRKASQNPSSFSLQPFPTYVELPAARNKLFRRSPHLATPFSSHPPSLFCSSASSKSHDGSPR